jgi:hypothetical protein
MAELQSRPEVGNTEKGASLEKEKSSY